MRPPLLEYLYILGAGYKYADFKVRPIETERQVRVDLENHSDKFNKK